MQTATYDPSVFTNVMSIDDAKGIILTPMYNAETAQVLLTSAERWETETPYLLDLIDEHIDLTDESVVLDYGCGIGRLAKGLIARHGCRVIGADISPNMRGLAASYVGHARFFSLDPAMLPMLGQQWADLVLAVWVLQHCPRPQQDLALARAAMKDDSSLFVVNEHGRFVPTREHGWTSDGLVLTDLLDDTLLPERSGKLAPGVVTEEHSQSAFWAVYNR